MRRAWTDKENDFLRKAYNNEPISKIAKALMRSEQSIRNHVHILRKKGFAFDRVKDRAIINAEKNFFTNEKWMHQYSTEFDESDDIEAAKRLREERVSADKRRKMVAKALFNPVDNA